ncbi:hypothetical protein SAMN05216262_105168 [Colwellia chukchiensis]|uniref:Transposase n=1 Tax=Colwellia chukchiensis TaxID=641665 RepID=A0A1H7MB34_9GAMM|nr:hypothetical protein SAMN05216262_105168 [Colwellia chukchiensis]
MSLIKAVGIDLAKLVFSIHGIYQHDKYKLRKTVKRNKLLAEIKLIKTPIITAINAQAVKILSRLHISDESWLKLTNHFEKIFTGAVGTAEHLAEFTEHVGLKRAHGIANAQAWLNSA